MKFICYFLSLLMFFVFSPRAHSQTIIDYQAWSGNTNCNVFGSATSVPSTENGFAGTRNHRAILGQPVYHGNAQAVELNTQTLSSSSFKGTGFRLDYTFLKGAVYKIIINAARAKASTEGGNNQLRVDYGFTSSTVNGCSGSETIGAGSGYSASAYILSPVYNDYVYTLPELQAEENHLLITGIALAGNVEQWIYIRKITIQIMKWPDLTLSPTALTVSCGSTASQTFTVSNPNNVANITSYEWNLGSANNGWTYNGSAALQNISTTGNTLTLTPSSSCGTISNVEVTVKVNNANYKTYNATATTTIPNYSLSGPSDFCTAGAYSIANLNCTSGVIWTFPSNIVSGSSTGNSIVLTRIADGNFTLTATVNSCGDTRSMSIQNIRSGGTPVTISTSQIDCDEVQLTVNNGSTGYSWTSSNSNVSPYGPSFTINGNMPTTTTSNQVTAVGTDGEVYVSTTNSCGHSATAAAVYHPYAREISGLYPEYLGFGEQWSLSVNTTPYDTYYTWYINNEIVKEGETASSYCTCYYESDDQRQCGTNEVRVVVTSSCGTTETTSYATIYCGLRLLQPKSMVIPKSKLDFELMPNPVGNTLTIQLSDDLYAECSKSKTQAQFMIVDNQGNIYQKVRFNSFSKAVQVNVGKLPAGIYFVKFNTGRNVISKIFYKR